MIQRGTSRGFWDVSCDRCSFSEEDVEAHDFRQVVQYLKDQGWLVRPHATVKTEWEHICLDCQKKANTAKVSHGGYADGTPVQ